MAAEEEVINIPVTSLLTPTFELTIPVTPEQVARLRYDINKAADLDPLKTTAEQLAQWLNTTFSEGTILNLHHFHPCINPSTEEGILYKEAGLTYCLSPDDQAFIRKYQINPYTGRLAILDNEPVRIQDPAISCVNNPRDMVMITDMGHGMPTTYRSTGMMRGGAVTRLKWPDAEYVADRKLCKPVTVYRGLRFAFPPVEILPARIGSTFEMVSAQASSWTRDLEIASTYSQASSYPWHLIIEATFEPADVLYDSRVGGTLGGFKEVRIRPGVYDVKIVDFGRKVTS